MKLDSNTHLDRRVAARSRGQIIKTLRWLAEGADTGGPAKGTPRLSAAQIGDAGFLSGRQLRGAVAMALAGRVWLHGRCRKTSTGGRGLGRPSWRFEVTFTANPEPGEDDFLEIGQGFVVLDPLEVTDLFRVVAKKL